MRFPCLLVLATAFSANLFADVVDSGAGFASAIEAGVSAPVIVLNSPSSTYNADQTFSGALGSDSVGVNISPGGGNVGLHGLATSDGVNTGAAFDLYWYDQFNITGTGAETFQYTLNLNGTASLIGDPPTDIGFSYASGGLTLYANSSYQTWGSVTNTSGCYYYSGCGAGIINSIYINAKSTPSGSTVTGDLTLYGGSSIELGLYLWARTAAYNYFGEDPGSANILAEVNAADTGWFTLTPITPGAGFTTASGLTYANSPDVATPEPAYSVLCCVGFVGLLAIRRFTNHRSR